MPDLSCLRKYVPSIEINLEPGVYVCMGGFGRTYLCSLLYKLRDLERVDSCTYPPAIPPGELLDSEKRDLVMLDRYDMYAGFGTEEIARFAERGIVLVACKTHFPPLRCMSCGVYMRKGRLVVN